MTSLVQTSLSSNLKHDKRPDYSTPPRSIPTACRTVASDAASLPALDLRHLDKQIDHHLRRVSARQIPAHLDRDDLRQNIYVAIIESLPNFDPNLSSQNTFQDRVIQKCIRKKLASFCWRKNMSECSLDDGMVDLTQQTSIRGDFSEQEYALFQTEVQNVIAALPDELKTICEMLMYYLPQEIASKLRVKKRTSKGAVQRRIQKIRTIFRSVGMTPDYFEENPEDQWIS